MPIDVRGTPGKNAALALRIEEIDRRGSKSMSGVAAPQPNWREHGLFAA
jgi:hypothetical protein